MSDSSTAFVNSYKGVFDEWSQRTATHVIANIARTHSKFIRIMWILFFLLSLTYCGFIIISTLIEYFKYDTVITYKTIQQSPTLFPAVTVCNLNAYDYYKDENLRLIDEVLVKNGMSKGLDWSIEYKNENSPFSLLNDYFTKLNRIFAYEIGNDVDTRRFIGFDLDSQMLLSCYFNRKPCNASDFHYFWSNEYGNCYTFNSGKNARDEQVPLLVTSKSGIHDGLKLELLVGYPAAQQTYLTYRKGIYLAVHNNSNYRTQLINGITIPTGVETTVSVSREFNKKLSFPYSNCLNSLSDLEKLSNYSKQLYSYMKDDFNMNEYDQIFCHKLCFQNRLVDVCDCCEVDVPIIREKQYCKSDRELKCLSIANEYFSNSSYDNLCEYSCPSQCNSVKYKISDHSSSYPSDFYQNELIAAASSQSNWTSSPFGIIQQGYKKFEEQGKSNFEKFAAIRDNIAKVSVNYDELSFTFIEEKPVMTYASLIGIIGGQTALFIGISLLSLVELIELLINFIQLCRKKSKLKNTEKVINTVYGGQSYPVSVYAQYY